MTAVAVAAPLSLPERLTLVEADHTLARLGAELRSHSDQTVEIDAASLQVFDSSALSVLLELRRRVLAQGRELRVSGWPRRLEDLASLYGVRELLAA
ncbi:STAS domain-containing protein [Hydrogenophaga laconesensis]|uniref:Phospholipid transport system transporter-binding protein n=1 Tax=Hydrogenophaga laconesensis TaxID=1805971 RepID=A0ABU1VAU4_9BURK|nr:STAS domain-containing protein [Hydrogenophaga laconesensis]MDR7094445.1 phospholipid transport system transporter-binding protein [Hydrogenophaga laconesensis]